MVSRTFIPVSRVAFAAVDLFLDIPGIPGESQDRDHRDKIDVLAWSWAASSDGCFTCFQNVGISKWVDLKSPLPFDRALYEYTEPTDRGSAGRKVSAEIYPGGRCK